MTAANFPNWIAFRSAVKSGVSSGNINLAGDSRIASLGAFNNDASGYTDARFGGTGAILAARLIQNGMNAKNQSILGTGTAGSSDLAGARLFNSNKFTNTAGVTGALPGFGAFAYRLTAGSSITFTTPQAYTDIDIWHPTNTALGSISYSSMAVRLSLSR